MLLPAMGFVDPATRATVNVKGFAPSPGVRRPRRAGPGPRG
jgi:hypothetical protein